MKTPYLRRIGYHAPNLQRLNLRNLSINYKVLRHIKRSLVGLKALDISNCKGITEEALTRFFENSKLCLNHISLAGLTKAVTSESLKNLDVLSLNYLDLSMCNRLDASFFRRFTETDRLPLKYLKLSFLTSPLLSSDLANILSRAPGLQLLDLESVSFPKESEPKSVLTALDSCFSLKTLNFSGVTTAHPIVFVCSSKEWPWVTDLRIVNFRPRDNAFFLQIILKCVAVEMLDVSNNSQLEADHMKTILVKLKNCRRIRMELTSQISEKLLDKFRGAHPQVVMLRNLVKRVKAKDSGMRVPIPMRKADWPVLGKKKKR